MNALLKTSLLGLALVSTASMAGNFAGPEAGVSVTMNGGSTLLDNKNSNNFDGNYGQQSIGIKLHGGYGFDLGNDTVVLVGFGGVVVGIGCGGFLFVLLFWWRVVVVRRQPNRCVYCVVGHGVGAVGVVVAVGGHHVSAVYVVLW